MSIGRQCPNLNTVPNVPTCNKVLASGTPEKKAWAEEVKALRDKVKAQVQVDARIILIGFQWSCHPGCCLFCVGQYSIDFDSL